MKWNESGFRPLLCTYRKSWARRTYWGWWDEWDDTALQTQDSKFKPWGSEAEHATFRSRRFPTILSFTSGWGRNIFSFKPPRLGNEPVNAAMLTTTPGPPHKYRIKLGQENLRRMVRWIRWHWSPDTRFKSQGLAVCCHTTESLRVGGGETLFFRQLNTRARKEALSSGVTSRQRYPLESTRKRKALLIIS